MVFCYGSRVIQVIKRNDVLICATTWMKLENTMQSEDASHKGKSIEIESPLVVVWGWEEWESCGLIANGSRVSSGGDEDVLKLIVVMVANSGTILNVT